MRWLVGVVLVGMATIGPRPARATALLERIELVGSPASAVRLQLSEPAAVVARTLAAGDQAPDRIYLDLGAAVIGSSVPTLVVGGGTVLRVRSGQFDRSTTRVVLDLAHAVPFAVRREGRTVLIELGPRVLAPPAPADGVAAARPEAPPPVASAPAPAATPIARAATPPPPAATPPPPAATPPPPAATPPPPAAVASAPAAVPSAPAPTPRSPVATPPAPAAAPVLPPGALARATRLPEARSMPPRAAEPEFDEPPRARPPTSEVATAGETAPTQAPAERTVRAVPPEQAKPAAPVAADDRATTTEPAPPPEIAGPTELAAAPAASAREPAPPSPGVEIVDPPAPTPERDRLASASATPGAPAPSPAPAPPALAPAFPVVVLDAGHGGRDPGAAGVGGVLEKDVVLEVTRRLAARLASRLPITVLMTRTDDSFVAIDRRLTVPPEGAALFLSLHANACNDPSARGLEVFYGGGSVRTVATRAGGERAARLGRCLDRALRARVGPVRGDARPGDFGVLVRNPVPSALVEIGYLTHPAEAARTQDARYQELLVDALADGVADYLRASAPPL